MNSTREIHITETPRDAMQGWGRIVPTAEKLDYIAHLLKLGFDTVDIGSFVSPKAVPQMADTGDLVEQLDYGKSTSRIMVVIGNMKGAERALVWPRINILAFPYSTSPTFLERNIHSDPLKAWSDLLEIDKLVKERGKSTRAYLSMAFGNPYGDPWSYDQILKEVERLKAAGISEVVFSDITGEGNPERIGELSLKLIQNFGGSGLGIHLHSKPFDWEPKVEAAWEAGFRYFETAAGGYGGCPMTGYELLGNLNTFDLLEWCEKKGIETGINPDSIHDLKQRVTILFR